MASSGTPKNGNGDSRTTTEDISEPIEALKADIANLASVLKSYGIERGEEAKGMAKAKAEELRLRGQLMAAEGQDKAEQYLNEASMRVREQPITSIGIAAGIGFLIGLVWSRK